MSGTVLARINHAADVLEAGGMGTVTVRDLREASTAFAELIAALADYDGIDNPSMPGTPPRLRRLRAAYQQVIA